MISAFTNSFKIEELRNRILFTAGIVVLCRLAANIPCPGIDPSALSAYVAELTKGSGGGGGLVGMFNMFSGGALTKFAVATLGIMPYISASIIMQLMVPVIPSLEKIRREGEAGRQKINQYTRYLTLLICLVQGAMAALAMINPSRIGLKAPASKLVVNIFDPNVPLTKLSEVFFVIMTVVVLTCGTMILMWLGEQITERGIGNGISIIICVNIIARMPAAVSSLYKLLRYGSADTSFRPVKLLILLLVFVLVTAATVLLVQGQRRIPIQMARRMAGGGQGNTTYLPLKVNFSGVMPIIFTSAILSILSMVLRMIPYTRWVTAYIVRGSLGYMVIYAIMILLFSFFWVANMFNPIQTADNLKREGAYIPGIRPGQPTADFLDSTMTKITFAGSLFLTALALFPMFLYSSFQIPYIIAAFFGGTSLLIIVGVLLDTLSQMEAHLVMRNYDGFLKKGKVRNRR